MGDIMKVKSIFYNWHQVQDCESASEDYSILEVGKNSVDSIEEFIPFVEGGKWNYLIHYKNGHALRVFNPNTVEYFPE